jgi:hypothetical protein
MTRRLYSAGQAIARPVQIRCDPRTDARPETTKLGAAPPGRHAMAILDKSQFAPTLAAIRRQWDSLGPPSPTPRRGCPAPACPPRLLAPGVPGRLYVSEPKKNAPPRRGAVQGGDDKGTGRGVARYGPIKLAMSDRSGAPMRMLKSTRPAARPIMQRMAIPAPTPEGIAFDLRESGRRSRSRMLVGIGTRLSAIVETEYLGPREEGPRHSWTERRMGITPSDGWWRVM